MEPAEAEQVKAALAALRAAAGVSREEVGDGALLAQLAARVLEDMDSSEAPTGERFRIAVEHCPRCGEFSTPEADVSETHVGQGPTTRHDVSHRAPGPVAGTATDVSPAATILNDAAARSMKPAGGARAGAARCQNQGSSSRSRQ